MNYKLTDNALVIRLDMGDDIFDCIKSAVRKYNINSGIISGIGTLSEGVIGVYSLEEKKFCGTKIKGFFEISNLSGNVTTMNGELYLHIHTTVADVNGKVYSGHLQSGIIAATAEIFIIPIDCEITRRYDNVTGLNILDI